MLLVYVQNTKCDQMCDCSSLRMCYFNYYYGVVDVLISVKCRLNIICIDTRSQINHPAVHVTRALADQLKATHTTYTRYSRDVSSCSHI